MVRSDWSFSALYRCSKSTRRILASSSFFRISSLKLLSLRAICPCVSFIWTPSLAISAVPAASSPSTAVFSLFRSRSLTLSANCSLKSLSHSLISSFKEAIRSFLALMIAFAPWIWFSSCFMRCFKIVFSLSSSFFCSLNILIWPLATSS